MQRVELLLCNDLEIRKCTRTISRQRLGKHVPAATDTNATMVQQQRKGAFYVALTEMLQPEQLGEVAGCKGAQLKFRLCREEFMSDIWSV
jgi:hypothetical protein